MNMETPEHKTTSPVLDALLNECDFLDGGPLMHYTSPIGPLAHLNVEALYREIPSQS